MDKINYFKWNLSLRKSLVLYMLFLFYLLYFFQLSLFQFVTVLSIRLQILTPRPAKNIYLTNEQGQQLGNGVYIGTTPASLPKKESQTIALLERFPIIATPIYSALCIAAAALCFTKIV